ncbi:MAG: hypothetical protein WCP06_06140 [Verrucomicrobiota bacterium]
MAQIPLDEIITAGLAVRARGVSVTYDTLARELGVSYSKISPIARQFSRKQEANSLDRALADLKKLVDEERITRSAAEAELGLARQRVAELEKALATVTARAAQLEMEARVAALSSEVTNIQSRLTIVEKSAGPQLVKPCNRWTKVPPRFLF